MLDEDTVRRLHEAGVSDDAAAQALPSGAAATSPTGSPCRRPARAPRWTRPQPSPVACPSRDRMVEVFDPAMRRHFSSAGGAGLGGDWVPRAGLIAELRRGLDFSGSLLLKT